MQVTFYTANGFKSLWNCGSLHTRLPINRLLLCHHCCATPRQSRKMNSERESQVDLIQLQEFISD